MNLFDWTREQIWNLIIKEYSVDGRLDELWLAEFPIMEFLLDRLIYLEWRRNFFDESPEIRQEAIKIAHQWQMPDLSQLGNEALFVCYCLRNQVLNLAAQDAFTFYVDRSFPQIIWAPYSRDEHIFSVAYVAWQNDFSIQCWRQLAQTLTRSEWSRRIFQLVTPGRDEAKRLDAYRWLKSQSVKAAQGLSGKEIGEDALHEWSTRLISKPLHARLGKLPATKKAIHDSIIDSQRKGGKYEQVSLDDALESTIPDDSQETPDKLRKLQATEGIQRLKEKRPEVEAILSEAAERNRREIGKRRYAVYLQPDKTSEQLATMLGVSEKTIDRDRAVIEEKRSTIQNLIFG